MEELNHSSFYFQIESGQGKKVIETIFTAMHDFIP